ncbi:class I adenylate-forming enzyme family protein [Azospirillum sp. B510]|uniref:class I adenylate-forming enzyme family protein n=1 Tax=Azospirillum sp. (strain B510) TaxID=137722 RepID=UPI00031F83B8|nr:AMP-binding protein [Azospirillum sp. B510]
MHDQMATLGAILEDNAQRFGDRPAYVLGDRAVTHGDLLLRARRLVSALHQIGLRRQDRVSILSMNSLELAEILAAAQCSGIIVSTVNFRLAPPEICYILNDVSPRVLIFEALYLPVIEALRHELPFIEAYVCIGGSVEWATDYESFLVTGNADDLRFIAQADDVYCVVYTSGTTGKPKGCIWGQREMRVLAERMNAEMRAGPRDRLLLVMPLFHIGAMAIALGLHFRGGTVYLQRQYDPEVALGLIGRERITHLHFAPTMLQMLLDQPAASGTDFSSLRTVVYSAAPMPTPLLRRAMAIFGAIFVNLYGQTEVITAGLDRDLHLPDGTERERSWLVSVGHPFPNVLVRIVDDAGNDCSAGASGEIVVKCAMMFRGYWNNHKATLETIRDGWCHTGDVGRFDDAGILYLVDRKKDMIISGGENIYSREVEEAIVQHPAVEECAVIGLPDEKWGEIVCAVVRAKPTEALGERGVIEHVQTLIASYKKPKKVIFVSDIPKLPTGKINKVELRKKFAPVTENTEMR